MKMRKKMRVMMVLLVVGLAFSLVGEAFARDRHGRRCHGRSFDRGPNYSDVLRDVAQAGVVMIGVSVLDAFYREGGRRGGHYQPYRSRSYRHSRPYRPSRSYCRGRCGRRGR